MNRLARERSPYLLQHAANPVDWYPWGDEAFARARARRQADLPLDRLLDLPLVPRDGARVVRERRRSPSCSTSDFVSIKVDREERPDVDRVYMTFVQATTGSGGWPMSVFLTPELKPFFGGTYFSADVALGTAGLRRSARRARARVEARPRRASTSAAAELLDRLKTVTGADGTAAPNGASPGADALDAGVEQFQTAFDRRHGGFGDAPKFPRPSELLFLLREHARRRAAPARRRCRWRPTRCARWRSAACAITSAAASIATRSTRDWRVPHFEKMLYDQAQLVLAYLEAAQATGDAFYRRGRRGHAGLRHARHDRPGRRVLSPPKTPTACRPSAATPARTSRKARSTSGRTPRSTRSSASDADIVAAAVRHRAATATRRSDPQGEFTGKNLLYIAQSIEDIATRARHAGRDGRRRARPRRAQMLFDARALRPRPHLDDKVLTAWNGLMIAASRARRACWPGAGRPRRAISTPRARAASFITAHAVARRVTPRCCAAIATARPRSTATPRTTRA